jgi:outer membrane protein
MKKLSILFVAMIALAASSYAQKVNKFGYLNSLELLSLMPEKAKADSVIDKYSADLDLLGQQMVAEYQKKATDAQTKADKGLLSDEQKEIAGKELADMEKRIQDFQQSAQQKIQEKQDKTYAPVLQKVNEAIKAVAKANGYTYIFDASAGSLLYVDETDNVLPLLKTYMKLPEPKVVAPKPGTAPK